MAAKGAHVLAFAVRGRVVLKYLGQLAVLLGGMAAVPLGIALAVGDQAFASRYAHVLALLLALGLPLARLKAPSRMQVNEALVVVALTFLVASLAMAWPLTAAGLTPLDALFESVSGITTTGLSILPTVEDRSTTLLFARAWMQWYAGLGFVVLALALAVVPGAGAQRLAGDDAEADDIVASTRVRARRALVVYGALTASGFAVLLLLGVGAFDALTHTLTGVSTAGFSTLDDSAAGLDGWGVRTALIVVCLAGAISFSLYVRVWQSGWRPLRSDLELRSLLLAGVATTLLVAASMGLAGDRAWTEILGDAAFMAFSAQTTTGFSTVPPGELDAGSKLALIAAMFIGGDAGSTAGGIKIIRFLIVLRLIQLCVLRPRLPAHAVTEPRIGERRLEDGEIRIAVAIVSLYLALIVAAWLPFLVLGHDPLNALFEVVSAAGTVGLSAGISSSELHPSLKGVLCVAMLFGRLEIVAFLVLLDPRNWFGRRDTA